MPKSFFLQLLCTATVVATAATVVSRGLRGGIERASKIILPVLLIVILVLISALAYYATLEAQFQQQRAELEAQKARFDDLVVQLQSQYDNQARGFGGGSGQFAWPERGPITQGFGCTDFLLEPYDANCATRHFHTGLDIGAPGGTTIHAADAGVVSFAGWGGGYGNVMILTHGNGYSTLYGHMSGFAVGSGDRISRGQPIGYEGSTGFSTGPHLHWEVRRNGTPVNPM